MDNFYWKNNETLLVSFIHFQHVLEKLDSSFFYAFFGKLDPELYRSISPKRDISSPFLHNRILQTISFNSFITRHFILIPLK